MELWTKAHRGLSAVPIFLLSLHKKESTHTIFISFIFIVNFTQFQGQLILDQKFDSGKIVYPVSPTDLNLLVQAHLKNRCIYF